MADPSELSKRGKDEWRARAKANRSGLMINNDRVALGLRRYFERNPTHGWIVAFAAMPGEPDVSQLFDEGWADFALTRTVEGSMDLTVHPWSAPQEVHRFGFRQPVVDAPQISSSDIGAVLVPGLAFDMAGTRLGHGAGYYDRFLSRLDPGVPRIGVSDGYIVTRLPAEDHDVPMTHLATEAGVMRLGSVADG